MKWKSQLVSELRGSMGGLTATHDQGGPWFRGRVHITQPNSRRQNRQRTVITNLNQAWQALLASQRLAWSDYAAAVPTSEQRGVPIYSDGLRHFIRANVVRLRLDMPMVRDAPTTYNRGYAATPRFVLTNANMNVAGLRARTNPETVPQIQRLAVYMHRPGRFGPKTHWRLMEGLFDAFTSPGDGEIALEAELEAILDELGARLDPQADEWKWGLRVLYADGRVSKLEEAITPLNQF